MLKPISGSSHVAAIDYEDGHIIAQYKDGGVYRWERPPEIFAALERAESKGRFLKLLGKGARVGARPVPAVVTQPATSDAPVKSDVLNSLTHEAESCCWRHFAKDGIQGGLDTATEFVCPDCGQEYRPRLAGAIRYWEAHSWLATW